MDFFGKVYNLDRTENFEDFVKMLKLPAEDTQGYINAKSSQKLEKDGDKYVLTSFYEGKPSEMRFKSGVEFEEDINPAVVPKSTITVEGNKATQVQKFDDGNVITYVREYYPDRLVVTITANFWPNGTAKRFYVAQ